jgi:hypothetical protein
MPGVRASLLAGSESSPERTICFHRTARQYRKRRHRLSNVRLVSQLGHEIANAKRRFVTQHFARHGKFRAGADCNQHRAIATLAGELAQL